MEPVETSLERLRKDLDVLLPRQNTNSSTITVSAGGMGLWVAVTCCAIMLSALAVAVPVGVGAYLNTQAQIRQLENTDNAIRAYINTGKMPPAPEKK